MKLKIFTILLIMLIISSCSMQISITMDTKSETVEAADGRIVLTVDVTYPKILDYEKQADDFIRSVISDYSEDALQDDIMYEFSMDCEVTYNKDNVVSILEKYYCYLGGAHGTPYYHSKTVNIKTGENLTPADFIDREIDVKQLFIDLINKNPDDFFGEESINMLNEINEIQFFVTETGLTFYVNPYDIAPYSTGFVMIDVPFEND